MKEQLEELNPWWKTNTANVHSIDRPRYTKLLVDLIPKKDIIILTGLRRVGKTTLLKKTIQTLLDQGVQPTRILFLSLDLLYFSDYSIQDIILEYKKIHRIEHGDKIYIILDEVTYKPHFNQELKNLYDLGNYKIFASSSSASKLKDSKAFLTGRARYIEIQPLDFKEFLTFRNMDSKSTQTHILESMFLEYMEVGGIPEYVITKDPIYISELTEVIIAKDIIAQYRIKNEKIVFDLFKLLCERVGKQISYNRIAKILDVDNETVSRYISYFLGTYLFSQIEMHGKLNQRLKGHKKLYCIDVGIRNVVTGFKDLGAVYENLVYTKIKDNETYLTKYLDFFENLNYSEAKMIKM